MTDWLSALAGTSTTYFHFHIEMSAKKLIDREIAFLLFRIWFSSEQEIVHGEKNILNYTESTAISAKWFECENNESPSSR